MINLYEIFIKYNRRNTRSKYLNKIWLLFKFNVLCYLLCNADVIMRHEYNSNLLQPASAISGKNFMLIDHHLTEL